MLQLTSPRTDPVTGFRETQHLLHGSVRHAHLRYGFQMRWNGAALEGRLGGRFIGERLRLHGASDELLGVVTGGAGNLAVRAFVNADSLLLRVVGPNGEISAETSLSRGTGSLRDRGSSLPFAVHVSGTQLSLSLSSTESVQLKGTEDSLLWIRLTAAVLALIVTREINRAQLESLRDMGEL